METAGAPAAIFRDEPTGAVIYTANTLDLDAEEIIESCPYNIPRKGPNGALAKCDMCLDRVQNGLLPSCVKTCPTGTMNFGDREEMLKIAGSRLAEVKGKYPKAMLLDPDDVSVIYLVAYDPLLYHEFAIALNSAFDITRLVALKRMFRPLTNLRSLLL